MKSSPTTLTTLVSELLDTNAGERDEDDAERRLSGALRRLTVLRSLDEAMAMQLDGADSLQAEAQRREAPPALLDALEYLRLYRALATELPSVAVQGASWFEPGISPADVDRLLTAAEGVRDFNPHSNAAALVLGKLQALRDRSAARRLFARVTAGESEKSMGPFRFERGAHSYLDEDTLRQDSELIDARRASLPARRVQGRGNSVGARFQILVSCERRYLRLHLPYWLSVADQLAPLGFAFHVLVVDEAGEDLLARADEHARSLARLRGRDTAMAGGNVTFSTVPLPPWCPRASSFAACARFLYAAGVVEEQGGPLLTLDIDVRLVDDPRPWCEALPSDRIMLYPNPVRSTLDPWRRFRAGVFSLPADDGARELMAHLERYLLRGLGAAVSWNVDQNALAFLHEQATTEGRPSSAGDSPLAAMSMDGFPFRAFAIEYLIEELEAGARA